MREPHARRFRLIAFDWDGTLADSTSIIADAIRAACGDVGVVVPDAEAARYVIGLGLADALRHVAPALPADRHVELAQRYRHHYLARDGEIPLFAGANEMLRQLDDAGYLLAVATGKSRTGLDRALQHHGLAQRFHVTRCADEGRPKPDPDMLHYIMATTGVTGSQSLMVGDTTHDLDLARNAGAHSLAVTYGAHPAAGLAAREPLASVDSIAALLQWIGDNG